MSREEQQYLSSFDKVISIEDHTAETESPAEMPKLSDMLCQLGNVDMLEDLGRNFMTASGDLPGRESGKSQGKFNVPFPRDYCYMMFALKDSFPFLPARGICAINKYLAMGDDLYRAAQYGRDAHEVRDPAVDPKAQELTKMHHWQWPYHGQIDVGALVIKLAHWVCLNSPQGFQFLDEVYRGEDGQAYTVRQSLMFRKDWILRRLYSNQELIPEFLAEFDGSHKVQTMEDSRPSHLFADGTLANLKKGVSSIEVMADTYDALLALVDMNGHVYANKKILSHEEASGLRKFAQMLQESIFCLWMPKWDYFALGYDRDENNRLRKLDSLKAISAFILDSGIWTTSPYHLEIKEKFVRRLFMPDMLAAAGFRTLSSWHPCFNPGRYHLGSVWPFMSFRIAEGLRRQGMPYLARYIYLRIVDTFRHLKMWPELIRGNTDDTLEITRVNIKTYNSRWGFEDSVTSVPQLVQGWSVSAHYASLKRLTESLPNPTPFEEDILSTLPAQ